MNGLNADKCRNGEEQYRPSKTKFWPNGVKYHYRHTNGRLFSTVAPSLEYAHISRDRWLERNKPEFDLEETS